MPIFLTRYIDAEGRKWCGPDIKAKTREEAEKIASTLHVLGPIVEEVDTATDKHTLYMPPEDDATDADKS